MNRIIVFVDGFNLYHAIDGNPKYHKYKWLDLFKLAHCYVTQKDKIEGVYYFTALATWSPEKMKRHKLLIKALELTIFTSFMVNSGAGINFANDVRKFTKPLKKNKPM